MRRVQFDAVVGQLYEAAMDISRWGTVIENIGALVSSSGGGQFHIWDVPQQCMLYSKTPNNWQVGETERLYNEHFAATDPRRRRAESSAPGTWIFDEDFFDSHYVSRSELYDFFRRYGVRYCGVLKLHASRDTIAALGIIKTIGEGGFDNAERSMLARISPHLVRATEFTIQLKDLRERASLGLYALDRLTCAVIVTDANGRVLHQNAAAESLMCSDADQKTPRHTASSISVKAGLLTLRDADLHRRLKHIIASAVVENRGAVLPLKQSGHRLVCRVVPLAESHPLACFSTRAALLAITSQSSDDGPLDALAAAFGLTPSEARLAIALQRGQALDEIAIAHGVAISTVRSQLKQLFAKTGTRRQAEIALLVRSISMFK